MLSADFLSMMTYYSSHTENEVYYYHGDLCGSRAQSQACLSYAEMQQSVRSKHLGSASWITNNYGSAVQHLQYLPYGENYINQRIAGSTYNERYTFTGKERDEETGYGYFGARYMDHELLTSFISVDRYADKYPSMSPYAYCAWNPIKLIDPSGDTIKNYYEQYPQSDIFHRTQSLIDDFRVSHPDEFNYLDNLSFTDKDGNTTPINIVIGLSDKNGPQNPDFGNRKDGVTKYNYNRMTIDQVDENNNTIETRVVIVGLIDNRISITLYKHHHDIGTLANEFGDAIFAVKRPETVDMQKGWKYGQKATTKYSFDYEKYIIGESKERPDPMNKETYKDTLK